MLIDVAVTPEAVAAKDLGTSTVLVVDVLRASTTMITALANGGTAIVPVADADAARQRARAHGGDGVLVAGERRGAKLPGFDLGNSPLEFVPALVRGRTVIFTTSNGTRALLAARRAAAVGVAAFVNLTAAVEWAADGGRNVTVVCAGERGRPSLEDSVCAGLLVDRLQAAAPGATLTAAAAEAVRIGRAYEKDVARLEGESPWARHLIAAGHRADVAACFALDTTTLVPVVVPGVDQVVAAQR